ncbi:phosphoribosylglycinamide formyltransferase [Mechercharimyces sp. CAU 1602]|uniref:phosphoribosylglycinamide formyltransferase n=1 Tax=Mechercharimyces sp. CAU 1602 TaxID=2973933 RepID=UPI0021620C14|nr:phosphoribosylglycinamide formyltransferase [Mechercharimyces sp. CAU 1602]MCS1352014.1 phosphoribosylglycinamide formyltransferase [Mechercharimyces sp. CAU 1602]
MSIAVFASGSGSNFEAIVLHARAEGWLHEVSLLVCDRPQAGALKRAEQLGIKSFVFVPRSYETKAKYEQDVLALLQKHKVEWVVLAGYMRLLGPTLLQPYWGKVINIHPSLLPHFPGKDAIGQALEADASFTGVTVHFVDEGMDTGQVIQQERVEIRAGESRAELTAKIQTVEHRLYPQVVRDVIEGRVSLHQRVKQ